MTVRPIDGDALKNQIRHIPRTINPDLVQYSLVQAIIADMPTLTPLNEWISVEERLPEGHMQVLMWSARWKIAEAGSYYNKHFWVYTEIGDGYIADNITHWMPLPEAPDSRLPEVEEDT